MRMRRSAFAGWWVGALWLFWQALLPTCWVLRPERYFHHGVSSAYVSGSVTLAFLSESWIESTYFVVYSMKPLIIFISTSFSHLHPGISSLSGTHLPDVSTNTFVNVLTFDCPGTKSICKSISTVQHVVHGNKSMFPCMVTHVWLRINDLLYLLEQELCLY